jgi:hypothetical protein
MTVLSGRDLCPIRRESWPGMRLIGLAGDIDRDGSGDLLLCALEPTNGGPFELAFRISSGHDGRTLRSFELRNEANELHLASAVLRDVDGDGIEDLAIGTCDDDLSMPPRATKPGCVAIVSGRDGSIVRTLRASDEWDLLGWSVADAGDVDFDGASDLLASSFGVLTHNGWQAELRLYSGASGALLRRWTGGYGVGAMLANAGDLNADGFPDHFVGALSDRFGVFASPLEVGELFLVSGFDGSTIARFGRTGYELALGR